MIPVIFNGFLTSRDGKAQETRRVLAIPLLKEAQEATRVAREANWNNFSVNGTYHPVVSGVTFALSPGAETINDFTRSIVIEDTYRDTNGKIVSSGGTIDPSTKKVTMSVSWSTPHASSVATTTYLSRYINNAIYTQTTQADFNAGTKTGVTVTNTSGGEVVLGAGGNGDWCAPAPVVASFDLPKQGVANAISAIEGRVFAGTGDNASGVSFADVQISNAIPPTASLYGTFDGYKTNNVFGETNYAYLSTDNHAKEIVVIDLTQKDINNKFLEAGYFDAPGNGVGNSVFVSGSIGYMTDGNTLYTFDLSSKSGSRPMLGSVALAATGNRVVVVGNYAYVALNSETTQLQIIQVSPDGKTLTVVGQASVLGDDGRDVFVNSSATRAYLATSASSTQKEMFIIDVSTKTGNRPTVGSYDTNGMDPKGITVVTANKVIVVGTGGQEYQVLDITSENSPTKCGGMNEDAGINGVASILESDGDAFSYIITGDANSELKIIRGGPGGVFSSNGTLESSTFDAGSSATYNRFVVTANKQPQTDIKFQVSGADVNPATGNCTGATFSFVGPDLTSGTYFGASSPIPLSTTGVYKNPARCFRYKAFLSTTDPSQTPTLYDMTVNYSP